MGTGDLEECTANLIPQLDRNKEQWLLTGNTARKRKRSLSFILITEVRLLDERFLSVFYFLKKQKTKAERKQQRRRR